MYNNLLLITDEQLPNYYYLFFDGKKRAENITIKNLSAAKDLFHDVSERTWKTKKCELFHTGRQVISNNYGLCGSIKKYNINNNDSLRLSILKGKNWMQEYILPKYV